MASTGLPSWLANPRVIPHSYEVIRATDPEDLVIFEKLGIEGLFSFQVAVREHLRHSRERDLAVSAPTGSGKTLSYALPILQVLQGKRLRVGRIRALVVVPTKDLVHQVEGVLEEVSAAISDGRHGKRPVSFDQYLVVTPGRLVDMLPSLRLEDLEFLVVDEADRLLEQSYQEWLPLLLQRIRLAIGGDSAGEVIDDKAWGLRDRRIHKLLFSATLTRNPAKIVPLQLYRPCYYSVSEEPARGSVESQESTATMTATTSELMVVVPEGSQKPASLWTCLEGFWASSLGMEDGCGVLVFVGSAQVGGRLCRYLESRLGEVKDGGGDGGRRVAFIQGGSGSGSDNSSRQELLKDLERGKLSVLIASDALARGIDIPSLKVVINYEAPAWPTGYVHRAGRCGRVGRRGWVVSLVTSEQANYFKKLLKSLGKRLESSANRRESSVDAGLKEFFETAECNGQVAKIEMAAAEDLELRDG